MAAEAGFDLGALVAGVGELAANYGTFAVAVLAFVEAAPRLKQLAQSSKRRADAAEEQARATAQQAEVELAALVIKTTDAKVGDGEKPTSAARRWRAQVMFDAYLEWRGAAHYANGGTFEGKELDRYLAWLRQALIRLEAVLIEAARSGHQEYWDGRVRDELNAHRSHLEKIRLDEINHGRLRELMRGK